MSKYLRPSFPVRFFKYPLICLSVLVLLISISVSLYIHRSFFLIFIILFSPIALIIGLFVLYLLLPVFFTGVLLEDSQIKVVDNLPKVFFKITNLEIPIKDIRYIYFVDKEIKNRGEAPYKITQVNIKKFMKCKKYPWDRFFDSKDIFKTLVISNKTGEDKIYIRYFKYYKKNDVLNLINHILSINTDIEVESQVSKML